MLQSVFNRLGASLRWTLLIVIIAPLAVFADTFRLLEPVQSDVLTYSDANITISFTMRRGEMGIGYSGIAFTITNKTKQAIEVDWDRSSITLPDSQTSNVMHEGTLFLQRGAVTQPTTIPPGGKLSDSVIPTRNVFYHEGWNVQPMNIKTGSQFGLYLAINGLESSKGYSFTFEAMDVTPVSSSLVLLLLGMLALVVLLGLVALVLTL